MALLLRDAQEVESWFLGWVRGEAEEGYPRLTMFVNHVAGTTWNITKTSRVLT